MTLPARLSAARARREAVAPQLVRDPVPPPLPSTDVEELVWSFRVQPEEPAETTARRSRVLLSRALRAGLVRTRRPEPQWDGQLSHLWRPKAGGGPVVGRRYGAWWWAPPGAGFDEVRHAPTCDSEPEALCALLDWLDLPERRRPDWLAGRRPDYLRRTR